MTSIRQHVGMEMELAMEMEIEGGNGNGIVDEEEESYASAMNALNFLKSRQSDLSFEDDQEPETQRSLRALRKFIFQDRLASPTQTRKPPVTITTLLPELQLLIFDQLGPVGSTCLGLTCKKFYAIHRKMHGTVGLMEQLELATDLKFDLWVFLQDFMKPRKWQMKELKVVFGSELQVDPFSGLLHLILSEGIEMRMAFLRCEYMDIQYEMRETCRYFEERFGEPSEILAKFASKLAVEKDFL